MTKFLEALKIIFFGILISIAYGIAHDMVTAHVYVEYFTVYHMTVVDSDSPVVMALVWGVIATWWVGLMASVLWCAAGLAGSMPLLPFRETAKIIAVGAVILLFSAYLVLGILYTIYPMIPEGTLQFDRPMNHKLFAVGGTHLYSYGAAALFAVGVSGIIIYRRFKLVPKAEVKLEEFVK